MGAIKTYHDAPLVPALLIFGDSSVDAGTNNHLITISRSNFGPYGRDSFARKPTGRFCNGKLVTDYIASMLGLPAKTVPYLQIKRNRRGKLPQKHLELGVSFASASSGFYDSTAKHFNALSLRRQLDHFRRYRRDLIADVGMANASEILSKALYIVSSGTNDYLNNYYFNLYLRTRYDIPRFQALILRLCAQFVTELHGLGARRIGVVSLPPFGCLPAEITIHGQRGRCVEHLNELAVAFNKDLQEMMASLRTNLKGSKLTYMDSYSVLVDAVYNPTKYGFEQNTKACCGSGRLEVAFLCNKLSPGTCKDASRYIFWDSFHPTDRMNQILAIRLFEHAWEELGVDEPPMYHCRDILLDEVRHINLLKIHL